MSDKLDFKSGMEFAYGVPRELAPGIVRIVANNPSPYTFKGTNSYLVGQTTLALVDPGPDDPAHLAAILKAAGDRPITHILLTHTHRDHFDGLASASRAIGAETVGFGAYQLASQVADRPGPGGEGSRTERNWRPDRILRHDEIIRGADWALRAIHTPGHTPDHLSFSVEIERSNRKVVLTGDHIMAWNTSVIAPPEGRLGDYMQSLETMLAIDAEVAFPGHGGQFAEPQRMAKAYLVHRKMRDAAILECIRGGVDDIDGIVSQVYRGLDTKLIPAAALSVLAHVEFLVERGLVHASSPLSRASVLKSR